MRRTADPPNTNRSARTVLLAMVLLPLVAGCERAGAPAPVVYGGGGSGAAPPTADAIERETEPVPAGTVVVERGDTLYRIARAKEVDLRALIEANGLRPPYQLLVGQRLRLPQERTHRVAAGETLYGISRAAGVDMASLARINRLDPPYLLRPGQVLRLPAADEAPVVRTAEERAPSAVQVRPPTPAASPPPTASASPTASPSPAPTASASQAPPARASGRFLWPVEGKVISSFGAKAGGLHNDGINIAVPDGAPVRAAENGIVAYSGDGLKGFGNLVLIRHADGWISAYGHNQTLLVERGQRVNRGQTIARAGSTGNVTAPQVHFELRRGTRAVDPRPHLGRV